MILVKRNNRLEKKIKKNLFKNEVIKVINHLQTIIFKYSTITSHVHKIILMVCFFTLFTILGKFVFIFLNNKYGFIMLHGFFGNITL